MSLWNKIRCFFGYHMWLEQWPDDWPRVKPRAFSDVPLPPWFDHTIPRMETEEDFKKKGWTRKCMDCGKVQKREEWT